VSSSPHSILYPNDDLKSALKFPYFQVSYNLRYFSLH